LDSFVALGAINRHRRGSASTDPWAIYRAWPDWKQDIVSMIIPETTLARFENVGYDVGMLRDGVSKAEYERASVPCLADSLRAMDENHPLLAALTDHAAEGRGAGYTSEPKLLESYCGYNIVHFHKKIFALSHSLGDVHVTDGVEALIKRYGGEKVIVAGTVEQVRTRVLDLVKARKPAKGAKTRIMLRLLVERLAKLSRRISVSLSR
jgi:hypothetical protein